MYVCSYLCDYVCMYVCMYNYAYNNIYVYSWYRLNLTFSLFFFFAGYWAGILYMLVVESIGHTMFQWGSSGRLSGQRLLFPAKTFTRRMRTHLAGKCKYLSYTSCFFFLFFFTALFQLIFCVCGILHYYDSFMIFI